MLLAESGYFYASCLNLTGLGGAETSDRSEKQ
jgi:hypothetical protein